MGICRAGLILISGNQESIEQINIVIQPYASLVGPLPSCSYTRRLKSTLSKAEGVSIIFLLCYTTLTGASSR